MLNHVTYSPDMQYPRTALPPSGIPLAESACVIKAPVLSLTTRDLLEYVHVLLSGVDWLVLIFIRLPGKRR